MSELGRQVTVDATGNRPQYEIIINDGGMDGGSNSIFAIAIDGLGFISIDDLEVAVRAFTNSLTALPGFTLKSLKRISVTQTTL